MEKISKPNYFYYAEGSVFGNAWGGGKGFYPARKYRNSSLARLKQEIKRDFKDGGLDSGMGFQNLIGSVMFITKVSGRTINNKYYSREDITELHLGDTKHFENKNQFPIEHFAKQKRNIKKVL